MRPADTVRLAVGSLWRQKLRTLLTLLGVVIGTTTLAVSLAVGLGVRTVLEDQFRKEERLREVLVFPNYDSDEDDESDLPPEYRQVIGEMSEERRARLKDAAVSYFRRLSGRRVPKPLTPARLEELAQLPHVVSAVPEIGGSSRGRFESRTTEVAYTGIDSEQRRLEKLLEAGRGFSSDSADEVVVHEYLLYRWGVRDDSRIQEVLGKPIQLEIGNFRRSAINLLGLLGADGSNLSVDELRTLEKVWKELPSQLEAMNLSPRERTLLREALQRKRPGEKDSPEARVPHTFTIVGVVRSPPKLSRAERSVMDANWWGVEAFIPARAGQRWHQQLPQIQKEGFNRVRVLVDDERNLKAVVGRVREMGFNEFSMGVFVEQVRANAQLIQFGMNFISLIALVVAAIGITNTLFTSVLERTREIGIFKAVGARDRDVQRVFLIEGALIGSLGGLLGLLAAWAVSIPGDRTARTLMSEQPLMEGKLPETVFHFTTWMVVGVPLFATLVTTLAAWVPARRAARIDPVIALRTE